MSTKDFAKKPAMRKKLLFVWSMMSLVGLLIGLIFLTDSYSPSWDDVIVPWLFLSTPLIIHLIYIKIFSEE